MFALKPMNDQSLLSQNSNRHQKNLKTSSITCESPLTMKHPANLQQLPFTLDSLQNQDSDMLNSNPCRALHQTK